MVIVADALGHAGVSPRNRDEERIARFLAEQVRRALAGEDKNFIEKAWPHRRLQLGVLPPLPPPEDLGEDDAPGDTDDAKHAAARAQSGTAPSTMAIDFMFTPEKQGSAIEVCATFSVYVQRYPSREQQAAYFTVAGDAADLDGEPVEATQGAAEDEASGHSDGDGHDKPKRPARMALLRRFERIDISVGPLKVTLDPSKKFDQIDLHDQVQAAVDAQLGSVLTQPDTVYPFSSGTQTMPETALDSDTAWRDAIREAEGDARQTPHRPQQVTILVSQRRDRHGNLRLRVTLENQSIAPRRGKPGDDDREMGRDMHLFNAAVRARRLHGLFKEIEFAQAPEDFRYDHLRRVWAHGSNAVAEGVDEEGTPVELSVQPDAVRTTTWPIFRQRKLVSNPEYEIAFADLAREGWRSQLAHVRDGMKRFLEEWDEELKRPEWEGERRRECEASRESFADELRRFDLGLRALDGDAELARSFREANGVFEVIGGKKEITTWRLFQLVYQVIHVSALRARETNDPEFVAELDTADVLWFPTGGGKTEAYLGLITIALFYDRLRGKKLGITAILRFPLRMLSVQQLARVGGVLWVAEERRASIEQSEGLMSGDPFGLGYYVGGSNTPNTLTGPKSWEKDSILWWRDLLKTDEDEALDRRVITECLNPACSGGEVRLEVDVPGVRLKHVCSNCGDLRVYMTDDEVFRYLPAVTVCTVDKLAAVGREAHVSHLISGPARKCPDHGYFTHYQRAFGDDDTKSSGQRAPQNDRCLARSHCGRKKAEYLNLTPEQVKDPVPALQVQDEMHLLQEELGAFDAHYETLYEHLQRAVVEDGGGKPVGKPTKLLAATATIERYEEQVRNLYARRAKVFPAPGWTLDRSFYTSLSQEAQRLYVGALPMLRDAAEFGGRVQALLHATVEQMQDDPAAALEQLELESIETEEDFLAELFLYELSLGYVNRGRDGNEVQSVLEEYERRYQRDELRSQLLAADAVTLAEIADTLRLIDEQGLDVEREDRLRGLVGTSIVSHGVDIDRLNLMIVNWMPAKIADYIQASSRSGRSHVGLVIVGHDRISLRDTSHFHYFLPYHRFLDRLVAPVPVNRFAKFAVERTLPGIVTGLILQEFGRKPTPRFLLMRSDFTRWWNDEARNGLEDRIRDRVYDSLGLTKLLLEPDGGHTRIFDQGMVDSLKADVDLELQTIFADLKMPSASKLHEMLTRRPLTSFRDVDAPIVFGTLNNSTQALNRLRPAGEDD
jgi:Helicase conserved C-terminal domain